MEFRCLVSFLALAEELHFGRAASRLCLAQPSVSQHLQRLEREMGVTLVSRSSHHVRLTPAGRAFQTEARRVLAQVDHAVAAAREAATGRVGTVRVGFNFPAGQHVLPQALTRLHSDHPGVAVSLSEMRSGPQVERLLAGALDVGLLFGEPASPELRSRRILDLPLVAVVGGFHPWAGRDRVPFGDLAHQQCVLFRRQLSPAMYDVIVNAAEQTSIRLNVVEEIDDSTATGIVVTTRAVVGFASSARRAHPSAGLAVVPLADPAPVLPLNVVWHAANRTAVVDAFLDSIDPDDAEPQRPAAR